MLLMSSVFLNFLNFGWKPVPADIFSVPAKIDVGGAEVLLKLEWACLRGAVFLSAFGAPHPR